MLNVWKENVIIPTYKTGDYEKYPMFFEKRVYQGSSGAVYPYPIIEKIYDVKSDQQYEAVFIENEYLKVMILPQLGGRVQMAWDKINQRHFIYYNEVIKPALVGLTGPWISGGIEFNWPQHHRPSTFLPVDCQIEKSEDGSCTVWVSETEKFNLQECRTGFTLYPERAYLEVKVRLFNGTPLPQTFLWWANPAVSVNEHYQSVFPPDVKAVYDHGKRDVSSFPIATGKYYKIDYSAGVDISMYKNIPVPTSYMAVNSKYDFLGGYEHDKKVGMIHLANHHVSPGKKMWTWGNSDFGITWNKHLTDDNGPYIELMAGVFTDNQPDFSWLQPYEERSFSQYFIPYSGLGVIKNASKELLLNVESVAGKVLVSLQSTQAQKDIQLLVGVFYSEKFDLRPGDVFRREIAVPADTVFDVYVLDAIGKQLLSYREETVVAAPIPEAARPPREAEKIESSEEAYLTGLHLEQYRHANFDPTAYYTRAIELDASDSRSNNALGMWFLRRSRFDEAAKFFEFAIHSQKRFNPNPANGEIFYHLGLALLGQGRIKEAYDAFYKATWSAAIQDAAWFECAKISTTENRLEDALFEVEKSLSRNNRNYKALGLRIYLLRRSGQSGLALTSIETVVQNDPFHVIGQIEKALISSDDSGIQDIIQNKGLSVGMLEPAVFDYVSFGAYSEALRLIELCLQLMPGNILFTYVKAWIEHKSGNDSRASLSKAMSCTIDYAFPKRVEWFAIFSHALSVNENDYKAHHLFGNFWYDKKQYDLAEQHWQTAIRHQPLFAASLRNLAIVSYNHNNDPEAAYSYIKSAFLLDSQSARLLLEQDQLAALLGVSVNTRRYELLRHLQLVEERDDLYLELIALYNLSGNFDLALQLLKKRKFHPWEGGEGKVIGQFRISLISKAFGCLAANDPQCAIQLLEESLSPPDTIGEAKLPLAQDQDVFYLLGCAWAMLGQTKQSRLYFKKASEGELEVGEAFFYNDTQADKVLYQGLAWARLGQKSKAEKLFRSLLSYGTENLDKKTRFDYFAVSFPHLSNWNIDSDKRNRVHCLFLQGLGLLGLGKTEEARDCLQAALLKDPAHHSAKLHYDLITNYQIINILSI